MRPKPAMYEAVRQHHLFSSLNDEQFRALSETMTERRVARGQSLFGRGDPAECFFFVQEGQIQLSVASPDGEQKVIEVFGPGRTFAEAVAFMSAVRYPVDATALADTILCQIPNRTYVSILKASPDACMQLIGDISKRLHARIREIEHLTVQNARGRLSSYLRDLVGTQSTGEAVITLDLPKHVLASRLSIKPETLSRVLRTLVDEGIMTVEDRRLTIHSVERLRPY